MVTTEASPERPRAPTGGRWLRQIKSRLPVALVLLGGLASFVLFSHGVSWWPVPVLVGVVHGAPALGAMLVVRWLTAQPRLAEGDDIGAGGQVLRRPRLYDWVVRVLTLGRERRLRKEVLDLAGVSRGQAVLDVGAGTGSFAILAAERVGPEGRVVAIEPAREMIEFARNRARDRGIEVDFRSGIAQRLACGDSEFDVVFASMVLHHLPAPDRALAVAEMLRVLRPGGRLMIVELEARRSLVTLFHGGSGAAKDSIRELRRLLESMAFESMATNRLRSGGMTAIVASKRG